MSMRHALGYLWHNNRAVVVAFVAVAVVTLAFGARAVLFGFYWSDPAHHDQTLQGWMTPRYIARSWKVPPEVVVEALEMPMEPARRVTLEELAIERDMPMPELAATVREAVETFRAEGRTQ
jgi:hypothetical protein